MWHAVTDFYDWAFAHLAKRKSTNRHVSWLDTNGKLLKAFSSQLALYRSSRKREAGYISGVIMFLIRW